MSSASSIFKRMLPSRPRSAALKKKQKKKQIPKKVQLCLPTIHNVFPISCAPRMQSSLDSGTSSQFGCNKGVVQSTLRACVFWLAALHIKQTGLSVSAQAAATKSVSPAWNTKDPHSGVLHRERLTTNTKHDSVHVSEKNC